MIEVKRKRKLCAQDTFRFVKQAVSIALLRLHMEATLREILDWPKEMDRVRAALVLERGELPGPSVLCKSFDRTPMSIWRDMLRLSSELLDQNCHAAIDATYFDRWQESTHYRKRCDRDVRTIQVTFLVDTAQGAGIDVHCSAKWPNGTKIGPQVTLRNAGDLLTLTADKGYDDMSFREALRALGVHALIKHRVLAPYGHAHNTRTKTNSTTSDPSVRPLIR